MSSEFAIHVMKEVAEMAGNPEKQAAFDEEMKRQEERRKKIDDLCMQAMEAMSVSMETIQKVLVENDVIIDEIAILTDGMSQLGNAMAQMRLNMGFGGFAPGISYGCGV